MKQAQAKVTAARAAALKYPAGVTVRARTVDAGRRGWHVRVVMEADAEGGLKSTLLTRPFDASQAEYLEGLAADLAAEYGCGGPTAPPPFAPSDDEPEPPPAWLAEAVRRVESLRGVDRGARRLALAILRGLELDGITAPDARSAYGGVVLTWQHGEREVELLAVCGDGFQTTGWSPGTAVKPRVWLRGEPGFDGFAVPRALVRWCYGLIPADRADMEALAGARP